MGWNVWAGGRGGEGRVPLREGRGGCADSGCADCLGRRGERVCELVAAASRRAAVSAGVG